ncbi:MAG TPA: hypothetical protein VFG65_02170 [Fimbriimonadales bacterium]|jgi:hypothetical protein|nr:hypothetical protein [Fimbriimonadales bacterium]
MSSHNPVVAPETITPTDWGAEIRSWLRGKVAFFGVAGTVVLTGVLIYYAAIFSAAATDKHAMIEASKIIAKLNIGLIAALLALGLAVTLNFWGDFALPLTLLLLAALFYFAPTILPWSGLIAAAWSPGEAIDPTAQAMRGMQMAGLILGIGALLLQVIDAIIRIRIRATMGVHADNLKYGSDLKEDEDYQNVFMGKCWQLPFCRKFVRQACPIYHSRRTCWKERVGCMCEEEVIRGALEGKTIPRDAVAAAKYIPRNSRLSGEQKAERCRQCVIYNEHQRQKYRLAIPVALGFVALIYVAFYDPLLQWTNRLLLGFDTAFSHFTFSTNPSDKLATIAQPGILEQGILFLIMLFVLSQIMKAVEFGIFRLKI